MFKPIGVLISCYLIAACGGGGSSPNSNDTGQINVEDYSGLTKTEVEATILKPATAEELETHLKNGMRLNVNIGSVLDSSSAAASAISFVDAAESTALTEAASSEYSSTNTHVRGVDEADFVKYDGQYLYMSAQPEYIWGEERPAAQIRILETDPTNAGITEVGAISISNNNWGEISELYLVGDQNTEALVTLRSSWNYLAAAEPALSSSIFSLWPFPFENKIQLASYDVADPSTPEQTFTLEVDGFLQGSRKIGDTLYLVTHFSAYFPFIGYIFETEEDAQENENRIAELELEDLLPTYRINGGEAQTLVNPEDCLIPVDLTPSHGYHNIVTIIAIDLASQEITSSKCLNSLVNGIYSTQDNLYIGGSSFTEWSSYESFTAIHKFDLTEGVDYRSTGIVPGTLGWDDPSFRMDEFEDNLRVVTTTLDGGEPKHHLSILQDSTASDEMTLIAQLPNTENPEPIGKPNEDIYAVRFIEDRAYIVTFERIDPLYVIDLSDAENPSIAGELNITGFSTYLHPVGDNYLLGIGQDATDLGVTLGLKVNLYDINNIAAPSLIGSEVIGDRGTWSSALYDLRAISFLTPTDDQMRFTFPASVYEPQWSWKEEALHLFEINGLASDAVDLSFVGKIVSESSNEETLWPSYSGTDRSVLHHEAVYYTHGNEVWASFWSSPDAATGPH